MEHQHLSRAEPVLLQWHSWIGDRRLHVSKSWGPAHVEVIIKNASTFGEVRFPLEFLGTFCPGLHTMVK